GYDFALVSPPYFYKGMMKSDVLVEHYRRVADSARIPILLYSVPQNTGVAIELDVAARLSEHPKVAGMKDSSGNVDRMGAILAAVPGSFQLMTGSATFLYSAIAVGARGGILALSNFLPELCVSLYDTILTGNAEQSLRLQRQVIKISNKIMG